MKLFISSTTTVAIASLVSLAVATPQGSPIGTTATTAHPTPSPLAKFTATEKGSGSKQTYNINLIQQKENFANPVNYVAVTQASHSGYGCHLSLYDGANQSGDVRRLNTSIAGTSAGTTGSWNSWGFYC